MKWREVGREGGETGEGRVTRWSREEERSAKEYKGRTDNNSPTRPNEAVHVTTLYYYSIYIRDKRVVKRKASHHPPLPQTQVRGRGGGGGGGGGGEEHKKDSRLASK